MKKIIYVTGSRAEYGVLRKLLKKLEDSPIFDFSVIITGMHLMKEFGYTAKQIKEDQFTISAEIDLKLDKNTNESMSKAIGYGIIKMTDVFVDVKPDLVLIAGDRGEMLSAAVSASHLNIPVAHISGGDMTSGATIDERIRHALTIFSSIHFPSNETSAKKVIKLGANKDLVFPVGNPGVPLKYVLSNSEKEDIAKKYQISLDKKLFLLIQHPVTTQSELAEFQMKETMEAINELKEQTIIIYPNSDSGSKDMINIINSYKNSPFISIYKDIVHEEFHKLLAIADVLIGNSSCALIEAPSFGLPCVNIGSRQENREHSSNIINVGHNKNEIIKAVGIATGLNFKKIAKKSLSPYAKENPEQKIVKILIDLNL